MMGQNMIGVIKKEILRSRYLSVSVDSTQDITHTDQLTIIVRYVHMDILYEPVERFLTFLEISSRTGQSVQQILKNKNSLVDYIPCAGHSLNLVGQSAADCCIESVSYFGFVQRLYTFFVASTHRWAILLTHIKQKPHCVVPKNLSDATDAIFQGY